jgi:hypothetical protein
MSIEKDNEIKRLQCEIECHDRAYKELIADSLSIAKQMRDTSEMVDKISNEVWSDLMDYCKCKSIAPSNFDLFKIIAKIRSIK